MYRDTRFAEIMEGLPRATFEKIVKQHKADKYSKGFGSWNQLISMIFAQISGSRSLRELEAGFNSQSTHHYHLGMCKIKRSTLADANRNRSCDVFEKACQLLLQQAHRRERKEIKDLLYLIDSTPISLKGLGYDDWTKSNSNYRTQGLKIHMMVSADTQTPVHAEITAPNVNDITAGKRITLEKGACYVFDKGYNDYNWWHKINQEEAFFVGRFKKNAGIEHVKSLEIPISSEKIILTDEVVSFKNKRPGGKRINNYYGTNLRRIVVNRPEKETPLILVTNDFSRSAEDVAERYKSRWGIELFFKWLKQNLKIKQFLGRSKNAVKVQIYTAIITYLLVQSYQARKEVKTTLRLCLAALKSSLFQRPEVERAVKRRQYEHQKYLDQQGVLAI